jgi:hypothetical protein
MVAERRPEIASRIATWLGNTFGILLACMLLFAAIESVVRAWLPEFVVGQNDEQTSRGKKRAFGLWGPVDVRLPSANADLGSGRRRIIFVGDSITDGHGLAFEDTYYGRLANMLAAIPSAADTAIVPNGVQGSNYVDNLERIERLPLDGVEAVYYQFNYDDVVPVRKAELVGMGGWALTEFNRFVRAISIVRHSCGPLNISGDGSAGGPPAPARSVVSTLSKATASPTAPGPFAPRRSVLGRTSQHVFGE